MNETDEGANVQQAKLADSMPHVKWDDSKMETVYANIVNAASTREEVSIFFGTNQTWDFRDSKEVVIELNNRMVLNPYAAKRLLVLLQRIIGEYEKRFGPLQIEGGSSATSEAAPRPR